MNRSAASSRRMNASRSALPRSTTGASSAGPAPAGGPTTKVAAAQAAPGLAVDGVHAAAAPRARSRSAARSRDRAGRSCAAPSPSDAQGVVTGRSLGAARQPGLTHRAENDGHSGRRARENA